MNDTKWFEKSTKLQLSIVKNLQIYGKWMKLNVKVFKIIKFETRDGKNLVIGKKKERKVHNLREIRITD
jgi:hypothetical protein